jgi:hypothetical protein
MAVWMAGCTVGTDDGAPTCEEIAAEVHQTLTEVAAAHRTCTVAEDCAIVWLSVTCSQSCSDVVGIGGVAAFEAALEEAENGICAEHPTCQPLVPPCLPPEPLDCVDGTCIEM